MVEAVAAAAASSAAAFNSESVLTVGEVSRILQVIKGCKSLISSLMITIVSASLSRITEYLTSGETTYESEGILMNNRFEN